MRIVYIKLTKHLNIKTISSIGQHKFSDFVWTDIDMQLEQIYKVTTDF
jgi:hypothetical protein